MPELPEVETVKRDLQEKILGLTIVDVFIYDTRIIANLSQPNFIRRLKNHTISDVQRRGKYLIFYFDQGGYLVVHLRMTGQLIYGEHLRDVKNLKETKVIFKLSNGFYLNYNDQRLFGRLAYTDTLEKMDCLKALGPEPLNGAFTFAWLKEHLNNRITPIKVLLINQNFLAGIGNIYASEILFEAQINPKKSSGQLNEVEVKRLYRAIGRILNKAIKCRGSSMRNYRDTAGKKGRFMDLIKVYARDGEPCLRCGTIFPKHK